ncbi:unnamed protein product [Nyctereutes procyonoides]|uniref:(raccoon dog) hypothetical protein n=1 Tax=Nyctereutes procyonoides TaxID=34880 RepID=A0A811ZED7_NYCPR|nr:unnamed protein product [Nyctereutes procyonoides]
MLAAYVIVATENPVDVMSYHPGIWPASCMKFAAATGTIPGAGHFTPRTFTNKIQAAFQVLRLLVVTDPSADHQPAFYADLPTITLCNTDSPLCYVALPSLATNKGAHSVLQVCGTISHEHPWKVMPEVYSYRDPEDTEKEEQAAAEQAVTKEEFQGEWLLQLLSSLLLNLKSQTGWSEGGQVPSVPFNSSLPKTRASSLPLKTGPGLPLLRPLNG